MILVLVVLTSGCTSINEFVKNLNNTGNKTYSGNGVSFNYPENWSIDNDKARNKIFVYKNVSFNQVQFMVQIIYNNGMAEQGAINNIRESSFAFPGWTRISNNTLTVDGKTAYEDVFNVNDTHYSEIMRFDQMCFVKNENTYVMILEAPDKEFDKEKPNFDIIVNSFKVK